MDRREFLKLAGTGVLGFTFLNPSLFAVPKENGNWDRILVLVELRGGNDGLNTLVPYREKTYYQARPTLAIPSNNVLKLTDELGLNPKLSPLMESWKAKDLAIVAGVGYPNPNRSHFRSIEIWETASNSNEFLNEGWIARLFAQHKPSQKLAADGLILDRGQEGPLSGKKMRNIVFSNPKQFLQQASRLEELSAQHVNNPSLLHLIEVQKNILKAAKMLQQKLQEAPPLRTAFPPYRLAQQLKIAAQLLSVTIPAPVIKVSMGSFDTHSGQKNPHMRLMQELSQSLAAFRKALKQAGIWDRVLVMTYSEFGRRVRENGSKGTDHGTAAPHFILGGKVKGGIYGKQPSLKDLDRGDLKFTTDYRRMYMTVAKLWWNLSPENLPHKEFKPLLCL
ncbi:MAG: DUF1501 domain-containing protein [Planctomycetota bacterium]|nr:MAG: DUF1501 domain-containing protein [Planctomycetota bacterium]